MKMGFKSKLLNLKDGAINSMIYNTYYNNDLDNDLIYLESRDGLDFTGNIFRIVEELSTGKYGDFKVHVHAKPHVVDKIRAFQKNYNLKIDKIITKEAVATKTLEKAKYIFTDSGIRPKYVKRQGQIFVNTWHGTPLKVMGRDNVAEQHRVGNVQHPLLSSDYLLYPNDYMMDKMLNAYMIEKIYPGKILLEGYPRNSVFFTKSQLKSDLDLNDYEIFVYMPTFRGVLMDRNDEGQRDEVEKYLNEIDSRLSENQILFVKLHVLNASQIDFSKFDHIRAFPKDYEVYDVLNMADVLITDYSSVFFDFANTKRKIILFSYDEADYESYRGFYFPLEDLPFPKVTNVDDLVRELNSDKDYDDGEFIDKFCQYDNPDAVENILRTIIKGENSSIVKHVSGDNRRILIYAGNLNDSLIDKLNQIDVDGFDSFLTYKQWDDNISNNHERIFKLIPESIEILPFRFNLTPALFEKKNSEALLKRSFEKQFPDVHFDEFIDLTDGSDEISQMFNIIKKK